MASSFHVLLLFSCSSYFNSFLRKHAQETGFLTQRVLGNNSVLSSELAPWLEICVSIFSQNLEGIVPGSPASGVTFEKSDTLLTLLVFFDCTALSGTLKCLGNISSSSPFLSVEIQILPSCKKTLYCFIENVFPPTLLV